jgi:hypothetical protein
VCREEVYRLDHPIRALVDDTRRVCEAPVLFPRPVLHLDISEPPVERCGSLVFIGIDRHRGSSGWVLQYEQTEADYCLRKLSHQVPDLA